jgi:hypothetical protein
VISTEMQQIGNKKVIHRRTREIICNAFDYMRITFPFEALTKIVSLEFVFSIYLAKIYLDIPFYGVYEKFESNNTFL